MKLAEEVNKNKEFLIGYDPFNDVFTVAHPLKRKDTLSSGVKIYQCEEEHIDKKGRFNSEANQMLNLLDEVESSNPNHGKDRQDSSLFYSIPQTIKKTSKKGLY